ncbi:hypothetical protein K438DRAFT_1762200 [Mycena galopus ATCC 62051]|nr:hypothetical protein K438DRAFT_1785838 [Mycena galopus ATCC 62051]KAF8192908.1 hypothetical protein K438DRAFT_1762200 [Mycena galopus ATCC 62051]
MTTTTTTLFPSPPAAAFSLPARSLRGHHATVARHIPNPSPSSLSHRRWGSLVTVSPPLPPPSPPPSSTPTAVTAAAPPATEPTVSVASKKARRPNPIHFTPWNLYMAVYADEVGGPLTNLPCTGRVWRPRIRVCFRSFRCSRTYLLLKIFDNTSKLFSEVPLHRRLASNDSAQRSGG